MMMGMSRGDGHGQPGNEQVLHARRLHALHEGAEDEHDEVDNVITIAFSSEVDTGSREENASKEDVKMPRRLSGGAAFFGKLALVF
jgi:hypothetical protein